jgi:hypothetical protein
MMEATIERNVELVRLLLEHGCDANICDNVCSYTLVFHFTYCISLYMSSRMGLVHYSMRHVKVT